MESGKRKHITLTLMEKMEIIDLCERRETTKAAIASMYGIGRSTVSDIFSNRATIKAFVSLHNDTEVTKRRKLDKNYVANSLSESNQQLKGSDDEETIVDAIDEYEYQEIGNQDYEIVYENSLPVYSPLTKVKSLKLDETTGRAKRKSRTLTFREKHEIIQQIEAGVPVTAISQSYDVGKTTIYDFLKRKDDILAYIEKTNDLDRRTFKGSRFPDIETQVLNWCESRETFTKEELFTLANNVFDTMKNEGKPVPKNGFCRSTWYKRFFSRNPQLKPRVVTATGEPEEFSKDNSFNDSRTRLEKGSVILRIINYDEKLDIIKLIEEGKEVHEVAEEYQTSEATIRDIFNKKDILRNVNIDRRKTLKSVVKHPLMELELLQWCLNDQIYPIDYQDIADQAIEIFERLKLKGEFEATIKWAKGFVMRHPQLRTKQGIALASEFNSTEELIEEDNEQQYETADDYEYLEEIVEHDPEHEEYEEEEYILEDEVDLDDGNYMEIEPKSETSQSFCIKYDSDLISDSNALKSLKTLITYAEQRGHNQILQSLMEYQSHIESGN